MLYLIIISSLLILFLARLNVSGNKISQVPEYVGLLKNLQEFILTGNQITTLPHSFSQLQSLEKLEIQNNLIEVFPDIGALKALEELNVSGNPLTDMTNLTKLPNLEVLVADGCKLKTLPNSLTNMMKLMELNLGNNELEKLPDEIGRMTRLTLLNLMDNQLEDLPMSMGYLIGLGRIGSGINIARNKIKSDEMMIKYSIGADHLMDFLDKRMLIKNNYKLPLPEQEQKKKEEYLKREDEKKKVDLDEKQKQEAKQKCATLKTWLIQHSETTKQAIMNLKFEMTKTKSAQELVPIAEKIAKKVFPEVIQFGTHIKNKRC